MTLRTASVRLNGNCEDIDTWLDSVKVPFQRAPRHGDSYTGEPFTLESVFQALRDFVFPAMRIPEGGPARPLGNFRNKVESIVRGMVDDSDMISKVAGDVYEAVDCVEFTVYYKCLQCGRFV